jgi:hypothetical protein
MIVRVSSFLLALISVFCIWIRCVAARVCSCPDLRPCLRPFLPVYILGDFTSLNFEVPRTLPFPLIFGSLACLVLCKVIKLIIVLSVAFLAFLPSETVSSLRFGLRLNGLLLINKVVVRIASLLVVGAIFLHSLVAVQVESLEVLWLTRNSICGCMRVLGPRIMTSIICHVIGILLVALGMMASFSSFVVFIIMIVVVVMFPLVLM